ncbi:hypothetical protein [Pseudomonas sp. RC3H12]|uniref:hypothetical protein n=1 Tax=Pseudomonas sp. RC3H12 TaxID=2834406 RepID=UPI001BDE6F8E|nr:hypothetical protein [Pseudomonas sp. RC3H12]QWA30511.1 hypothetical protein KHO27_06445 [Pseudomonas sp. RC3H12]
MQRKDTFQEHRDSHKAARIAHIHSALKVLSRANYKNITSLARGVAKIVTEYELSRNLSLPEHNRESNLKPVSHVTLLRNSDYRKILEKTIESEEVAALPTSISASDYEALKIRNAGLEGQVAQLKHTIINLDSGGLLVSGDSEQLKEEIVKLSGDIKFLIAFIDGMQSEAMDVFVIVKPGEESLEYSEPGYHGVMNMVATYDELIRLEMLRRKFDA